VTNKISNKALLDEAAAAIKQGKTHLGEELLRKVLTSEPDNVLARLWLTKCTDDPYHRVALFQRVLSIDPSNAHALKGMKLYRRYARSNSHTHPIASAMRTSWGKRVRTVAIVLITLITLWLLALLLKPKPYEPTTDDAFSYAAGFALKRMIARDPANVWCSPSRSASSWWTIDVQSGENGEYKVIGATRAIDAACVFEISYFTATVSYNLNSQSWDLIGDVYFSNSCITLNHQCVGTLWQYGWSPDMNWTPPQ
jgi:hypothetical protein